jgi:hypothetical protein
MTEAEWAACSDPSIMLEFLRDRGSDRKLRLFSASCCRRLWSLFWHEDIARSVELAERFAEGRATDEELRRADELAMWAGDDASWHSMQGAAAAWAVAAAAHREGIGAARGAVYEVRSVHAEDAAKRDEEQLAQCRLLRDILGNPFRPVLLDPSWQVPAVVALATAVYEERDLPEGTLDANRLAVLADALEDAGCDSAEILSHLRGSGLHVRGCWAVELLLGKQ